MMKLLLLIICLALTGCATKAQVVWIDGAAKLKCTPLASCSAKDGEKEIKADGKFNPFKNLFSSNKVVI